MKSLVYLLLFVYVFRLTDQLEVGQKLTNDARVLHTAKYILSNPASIENAYFTMDAIFSIVATHRL